MARCPIAMPTQNPNLIRVYIDAQHDYLLDRTYLLGALVVASEGGVETPERRRSVVRLSEGPPDTPGQGGAPLRRLDRGDAAGDRRARRSRRGGERAGADPPHLLRRVRAAGAARRSGPPRRNDPGRDAALRLRDPAGGLRLADRDLSRAGDPRPEELPDGLPVVAGGGGVPAVRLERGHALPRHLPGPALRLLGQAGAGRGGLARSRGWGAGTPVAPASTARSRSSTPMRPGAICRGRHSGGTTTSRRIGT